MKKENKQRLIDLELEYKKEKYPSMPIEYLTTKTYNDNSANALTKSVIAWITLNGYQAERISNTGRVIDNRKTYKDVLGVRKVIGDIKYIKGQGTNGTADISATIKGRSVKIEIKYGKDRQSEAQKHYQDMIERAGGVYVIVKDFDSFVEWYENFIKNI